MWYNITQLKPDRFLLAIFFTQKQIYFFHNNHFGM